MTLCRYCGSPKASQISLICASCMERRTLTGADRKPNEISVTFTGTPPVARKQARAFGAALAVEDADRCTCGEPIDLELDVPQTVRYQNLRITGCVACDYTGEPSERGEHDEPGERGAR